ncbi:hypothetical protein QYE76_025954 [Lolium multiflorum]|uniref:Uncharacterized protein n=1 Tax=Lolium multiflorum TaxID=4521 RepID=A0AAD8RGD8_LOLMU|nr:hypothetical protein QYE76_025954 [Lolium multiflorum]
MAIEQGRLIFNQYAMKVDTHPFPAVNMVECTYHEGCQPGFSFNINMVGPGHHCKDGDEGSCSRSKDTRRPLHAIGSVTMASAHHRGRSKEWVIAVLIVAVVAAVGAASRELLVTAAPASAGASSSSSSSSSSLSAQERKRFAGGGGGFILLLFLFLLVIIIVLAVRPSAESLCRRMLSGGGGIILLLFLFFLYFFFFLLPVEEVGFTQGWRSSSFAYQLPFDEELEVVFPIGRVSLSGPTSASGWAILGTCSTPARSRRKTGGRGQRRRRKRKTLLQGKRVFSVPIARTKEGDEES